MTGAADLNWMNQAACTGIDVNVFYPNPRDGGVISELAAALCATCPVKTQCTQYGLTDEHGIYGGLTPAQRSKQRGWNPRRTITVQRPHADYVWPASKIQPCGTVAAYRRHRRHGQPACEPCIQASRDYTNNRRAALEQDPQ